MGAAALIEAGLVKPGTKNAGLDNPNNWLNGLSKSKFLMIDNFNIMRSRDTPISKSNILEVGSLELNPLAIR